MTELKILSGRLTRKTTRLYELLVRLKDFGDEIFTDTNIDFLVKGISTELEHTSLSTDMKRHLTLIFKKE